MKKNNQESTLFHISNCVRSSLILLMCIIFTNVNAQTKSITGTVVDEAGIPMAGVNILVQGTSNGVQSDFDGNYSINASIGQTLVFSYVGMKTQSVVIGNQTSINITLAVDSELLDEVIVVGYGTKKKSDVISSVASVRPEDMTKVATSDVGEMLRGKATGVLVTLDDGGPGSSSNILIRGRNSVEGNNSPIVIADGVTIGSINDINPNDIASLEILKDAAAQAIYGARASNGVILITTKRGKEGKTMIAYNGQSGVQTINRSFDIYSGAEFAQLKREAIRADNGVFLADDKVFGPLELASVQSEEYINWEELILRTGATQNHNVSISSGTENTSIYTSFNIFNQQGVIINTDYNRITARVNVDQRINDWLKIGMNTSLQFSKETGPNTGGVLLSSITTTPLGQIYEDDGVTYRVEPGGFNENKNPLIDLDETDNITENRNDILNVFMDFSPFKGFNYRLNASRRSWNYKRRSYNTANSLTGIANGRLGNGSIRFQDNVEWQIENIFTYTPDLGDKNNLNFTAVHSVIESRYNNFENNAADIPNDILGIYGLEAAFTNTPQINGNRRGLVSFVGRVEYDYNSKYYLSLSARADASTVFGANNKWAYFPAAGIGWNVHNESFMEDIKSTINNLKLRGSYGSVGNEGIGPYQSLTTALQRDYIIGANKVSGYVPGDALPNPDLRWETSTTLNVALDLGLFQNRITSTVEYYNTRTKDLLIEQALSAATGYSRRLSNIGEVENAGIEVSLSGDIIRKDDFRISLGGSVSINKNKIISLYGFDENGDGVEDDDIGNDWYIGKPIDVDRTYVAVGFFQEGEDILNSPQPLALPGDVKLFDSDPTDGIINTSDQVIIPMNTPDWFGNLNLSIDYKGIDLSADLLAVQGITRFNAFLVGYNEGGSLRGIKNGIKQDYWTPENPTGNFPRPRESNDPPNLGTLARQDASYIRLQNVTLGYSINSDTLSTLGLSKLRVFITGSNLLTITDFQSYSPEKNPNDYPEAVTLVAGLQVSF